MIDKRTIFEIHRLKNECYSARKIAIKLNLGQRTVLKYLRDPNPDRPQRSPRMSILDPFRQTIEEYLKEDPHVSGAVVLQRLAEFGFQGKRSTVNDYLKKQRGRFKSKQVFIRFESHPGQQFQIDWGHFGSLSYGDTKRKLYALAVVESYSRMLYVAFTHSQNQDALHQCLVQAFLYFGGTPREIVVDNMLTAVTERQGSLIRFNEAFLEFLRPLKIVPKACNVRAPYEKGKVERQIGYIRRNFWPLRKFSALHNVQSQVLQWLEKVANQRIHQTTQQRPIERFNPQQLNSFSELYMDCRQVLTVKTYKDFCVIFDTNTYSVPPWCVGKNLTLKADQSTITLYDRQKSVAIHQRCWERKKRIELPSHREQVKKLQNKLWEDKEVALFASLGTSCQSFLNALAQARQPIRKSVKKLLSLKDQYGNDALIIAINKALEYKAYAASYVENILHQEMTPQNNHLPVKLKDEKLNNIHIIDPSLEEYDAYILEKRRNYDRET